MDRNTIVRWILIAGLMVVGYYFLFEKKSSDVAPQPSFDSYVDAPGYAPELVEGAAVPPPPGETCSIKGNRFQAEMSSRGAALTHFYLTDAQYQDAKSRDVATTPAVEQWRNLRMLFKEPGKPAAPDDLVRYDRFDWKTEHLGDTGCRFTYEDDQARIVKTVKAGERPFELDVDTTLTNLSDAPKKETTTIAVFAFRTEGEVKSNLGRVSPFLTGLECARGKDVKRLAKDASEFKTGWYSEPLVDRYAAIANYYFAEVLVPMETGADAGGQKPSCDLDVKSGFRDADHPADENLTGAVYKARLSYPSRVLGPKDSASYHQIAFFGPKERDVLAAAAGGQPHLQDLINLGTFAIVAKVLVQIITWIHFHVTFGNWGLAIIVLTLGLRTALFPLTWKQIKSAIAMRKLKPEIDALNKKFKEDPQAKNVAMMELWRKHKVNPLGGCLPALVQMPIWFALYATLQTAVEFYHTPFLWFPDLSAPDQLFFHKVGPLPIILGAAMIVQQRITPTQGMDPMQQKLMNWLMPGVFTVMMLFLPAALGVYMLTNSLLGITQQLVTQRLFPNIGVSKPGDDIVVKADKTGSAKKDGKDAGAATAAALRKGKARV